jgi:protein phosphatase 2C-like protein
MGSPWKILSGSAVGTSHERQGEPCQDYAQATIAEVTPPVLVAVCADGAGSAAHARLGARLAGLGFIRTASQQLRDGLSVPQIDARQMLRWHAQVRGWMSLEASLLNRDVRDLACTLLTAIVGEEGAVFSQIGDGAIVYREGGELKTAFWPQTGEYANTTFFLTGQDFEERLAFRAIAQRVDELALFTDGLQSLALHYVSHSVHAPFFEPMFELLRRAPDTQALDAPLGDFLQSKPVNDRTDDDKTLVLATRRTSSDGAC